MALRCGVPFLFFFHLATNEITETTAAASRSIQGGADAITQ